MAFHQPAHPPPRAAVAHEPRQRPGTLSLPHAAIDDSQEWIVFSPSQYQASPTLSTELTSRTAGLSRLSDFGSLNTIGRTEEADEQELSDVAEDDDELDSLDDGLHAFREPASAQGFRRLDQSGGSILPAHDGLGTFLSSNAQAQEQIWNHERYNSRRRSHGHYRTLSSVQRRLEALDEEAAPEPSLMDDGRLERIQKWRFEQSNILLEELSRASSRAASQHRRASAEAGQLVAARPAETDAGAGPESSDTLWERITRTVMRNIMGIDEALLSIILGKAIMDESRQALETVTKVIPDALQRSPSSPSSPLDATAMSSDWETRLVRRIARELGHLVQHFSATPKALGGPIDASQLDYAGMPIKPSTLDSQDQRNDDDLRHTHTSSAHQSAAFHPTIQPSHTVEDVYAEDPKAAAAAEAEYWEQTPDLRSVFSYLTRRFLSRHRSSSSASAGASSSKAALQEPHTPSPVATSPSPAFLHRATIIQQHHPLVARSRAAHQRRRRSSLRLAHGGAPPVRANLAPTLPGSLKRVGTSCASCSTKRSKLDASEGGSRNYWDIGGSLGSESLVLGGVGFWGEV